MGDKDRFIPITGLLLMFAILGVIIFTKTPFEGSRPPAPEIYEPYEKIKARLWQDPFLAILSETKARVIPSGDFYLDSSYRNDKGENHLLVKTIQDRRSKGKVTAVGVMVFGAPYAEEGEMRIRHRYATLSALRRLGFVPDDPEHIEFLRIHPKTGKDILPSETPPAPLSMADIIPFEWLHNVNKQNDSVLLLWINDDVFQKNPLYKLRLLYDYLASSNDYLPALQGVKNAHPLPFKVIGPAGSTSLGEMLRDAMDILDSSKSKSILSTQQDGGRDRKIEIYSATATVDDSSLQQIFGGKERTGEPSESLTDDFEHAGFPLYRTICSDRDLADKIFEELKLRGIDGAKEKNHVVLLSEWDTDYGRSMAKIYRQSFQNKYNVADVDRQIHRFTYMRGIDGKIPEKRESGESSEEKKSAAETNSGTAKELEQASGRSQFDYIRRLADEIYRFEQQFTGGGSIKAIGILGSDFHDKYLLLQAMRQRFPQTVFFTTDLDARFLHTAALPWTRNLIIAAPFDLCLRSDNQINIQGNAPPFRDSYQTSIFFAILKSFAKDGYLDESIRKVFDRNPKPKIFEIGRYQAVKLSEDVHDPESFDPRYQKAKNSRVVVLVEKGILILLLLIILLFFCSEHARALISSTFSGRKTVATIASFFVMALALRAFYVYILLNANQEEPLSFMEGISIWPTELLRLVAAMLSLFLIYHGTANIRRNAAAICRDFGFTSPSPKHVSAKKHETGGLRNIAAFFRRIYDFIRHDWDIEAQPGGMKPTIDDYWNEYQRRDSCRYRIYRLVPILVSYIALCGIIISLSQPETPVRGVVSTAIDIIVLSVSVLATIFLIFYAFDVIRTCRRFIDLIAGQAPRWSEQSFSRLIGFHEKDAKESMGEWMLISLVARRTEAIGRVVFYPFIVWFILFVSRLNYFDNWHTPIGLAIVITLGAVYAWSCAWVLRRSAEKTRQAALERLMTAHVSVLAGNRDEKQLKRIEFVMDHVKSIQTGAFAPFTRNPVIQALLVPFGGVGGVYIFDILGKLNI